MSEKYSKVINECFYKTLQSFRKEISYQKTNLDVIFNLFSSFMDKNKINENLELYKKFYYEHSVEQTFSNYQKNKRELRNYISKAPKWHINDYSQINFENIKNLTKKSIKHASAYNKVSINLSNRKKIKKQIKNIFKLLNTTLEIYFYCKYLGYYNDSKFYNPCGHYCHLCNTCQCYCECEIYNSCRDDIMNDIKKLDPAPEEKELKYE